MLRFRCEQGTLEGSALNKKRKGADQALKEVEVGKQCRSSLIKSGLAQEALETDEIGERIVCHLSPNDLVHFALTSKSNLKICGDYKEYFDTSMNTLASSSQISGVCFKIYRYRFVPICDIETRFTTALKFLKAQKAEDAIAHGADINAKNEDGNTPLRKAAIKGQVNVVKALINAGAELNARDGYGNTPLHWAAYRGHTEIAQALIDAGAVVSLADNFGNTPLHEAARNGRTETVRALIAAGANVNARNENGATPLFGAASQGHTEIAQALIDAGADVNARNENEATPLFGAAYRGHTEIVQALIDAGAVVSLADNFGNTPLHFAASCSNLAVVKILRAAIADSLKPCVNS